MCIYPIEEDDVYDENIYYKMRDIIPSKNKAHEVFVRIHIIRVSSYVSTLTRVLHITHMYTKFSK